MKAQGKRASYFRKYDYKTGKIYKQVDLDSKYFEGITFLNDKLYQLTWQEKQALSIMLLH
jgi:glutamine cyclotransferase